jgi:exodeoxyribonuclease-3
MRVATWNVNSLKARLEAVELWLERATPDVLLMQETKLADDQVPGLVFEAAGYEVAHHGEGRWNGVAVASRLGIDEVVTNFGIGPVRDSRSPGQAEEDFNPFDEARMLSAVCGGIRFVSLYAPNGRVVGSPFYEGKLAWLDQVHDWLAANCSPDDPVVLGGDLNVTPADEDVWKAASAHGGTHVSAPERRALERLRQWGLVDAFRLVRHEAGRFSWWDYRAGRFHRNEGMRIDLLYVTAPVAARVVWAEIDREARKGRPTPSDHAPVVVDLDEPGRAFDAGWERALDRIAARTKPKS